VTEVREWLGRGREQGAALRSVFLLMTEHDSKLGVTAANVLIIHGLNRGTGQRALRQRSGPWDGEIVHLGTNGKPLFYELMRRRTPHGRVK